MANQDVKDNKHAGPDSQKDIMSVLCAMAENIEKTIAFAGATATNVVRRGTTLRIAGIHCRTPSPHNKDEEDEVLVALRLEAGKSLARCNCRVGQKRRKLKMEWIPQN